MSLQHLLSTTIIRSGSCNSINSNISSSSSSSSSGKIIAASKQDKPWPGGIARQRRLLRIVCCLGCGLLILLQAQSHDRYKTEFLTHHQYGSWNEPPLPLNKNNKVNNNNNNNNNINTTKDEIRAIFDRWNEAVMTGDPRVVANLYLYENEHANDDDETDTADRTRGTWRSHRGSSSTPNGPTGAGTSTGKSKNKSTATSASTGNANPVILLPTLSDAPRTDRASVEDYFASFLKRRPKGRIVGGHVRIGPDGSWAHDAGIYEFELDAERKPGATADNDSLAVVRARYSFLYLRDRDGEWKIAHHHSSLLPETSGGR